MADKWIQLQSSNGEDNLFPTTKMDLLWTNSSPNSSFASQTLALDLSGYKIIYILFRRIQNEVAYFMDAGIVDILNASTDEKFINSNVTGGSIVLMRWWRPMTTGIWFADATRNGTTSNTDFIPYQIYGIK